MSRREVAVVLHEDVLGGASLSIVRLATLLERRGWSLRFWVARPSPLYDALVARGLRVDGAPRPIAYSREALRLPPGTRVRLTATPGYLAEFRRWLKSVDASVVHANSLFSLAEAVVASTVRTPVVFHVHEMLRPGRKGQIARAIAHRLPGEMIGVSASSAERLALPGRPVRFVYEAAPIPDEPFTPSAVSPFTVGTVGVVSTRKGTDVFVEAAEIVARTDPAIRFHIVGGLTDSLEVEWGRDVLRKAQNAGVIHEECADVPERLAGWSAFALPSRRDPFPISVLEAMGSGLPVVGADVDGISEQLGGESGLLVPAEDPDALADAILRLSREPDLCERLGANARIKVLGELTLDHQADRLASIYEDVVSGSRGKHDPARD